MNTVLIILGALLLAFAVLYLFARSKMKNIPVVEDSEKILTLTDRNFQHQTKDRIVLVDFWAGWCVSC
jgi:thioredoxin 1